MNATEDAIDLDPEIDLTPLHGKVAGTVSLWVPWNLLHRETLALLPLAAAPELAPQLGLGEEDCYDVPMVGPCLVLPTGVVSVVGSPSPGEPTVEQGGARFWLGTPAPPPHPGRPERHPRDPATGAAVYSEKVAEHNRRVSVGSVRDAYLPPPACRASVVVTMTRALRDQQLARALGSQTPREVCKLRREVDQLKAAVAGKGAKR